MLNIIVTIILALFVYKYTSENNNQNYLSNLDSKSEWRKKLFEIAGKKDIGLEDIYQIRAAVRFDIKKTDDLSCFEIMTNTIISFCETKSKLGNINENDEEIVRLFARYLLTHQWEFLQLSSTEQYIINKNKSKYSFLTRLKHNITLLLFKTNINTKKKEWEDKQDKLFTYTNKKYNSLVQKS